MHAHLVFVTKYRKKIFTQQVMRETRLIFKSICKDFEAELVELDGEKVIHLFKRLCREKCLVAELFCRILWRGTDFNHSSIH